MYDEYFQHGKFTLFSSSIVREQDLLSFCPVEPPYINYVHSEFGKAFLNDKAVMLANRYWEFGDVPESFKWLQIAYSDTKSSKKRNKE